MSEDPEMKREHEEEQDEVEAHRAVKSANEEGGDETDADDDVEAHGKRSA